MPAAAPARHRGRPSRPGRAYDSIGSKAAIVAELNDLIDVEGDVPALAAHLESLGALKPGLDPREAGDVIAVLTDPQVVQTMVQTYGWSWDRWHQWTLDTLCTLVLSGGTWRRAPRSTRQKRSG